MKYLKMLGLAGLAAIVLMALAGAGSASATVLCKKQASPCTEAYGVGTELHLRAEAATIDGLLSPEECPRQTIVGKISSAGGKAETVSISNEAIAWENCPNEWEFLVRGSLEVHYTAEGNGTVTLKGSEFRWTSSGTGERCVYGAGTGTDFGTLSGGNPATVKVSAVLTRISGGGLSCPTTKTWTANFEVTTPTPLYVAES